LDPEQAAAQYAEDARKSLVSFLQRKNFGISAVTAFPEEFNYLTVGNGTSALLSIRDPIGNVRIGHGFILRPTAALRAFIQEALSPERLIRELLPRGPDEPTRMLGSALLRAFAAPVAGTWRGLSAARRRERVLDMAGRITDAIRKGQIGVEVFKVPGAKTSGFRQIADQILARVTQSELPRPQKGKRE
jgi:hypothetical protein